MKHFEIDGCDLHLTDAGQGPLVLLVHGTAANMWGEVPSLLALDHRVIDYDRRSFDRSHAPPLASLRRHTDDAAVLLERAGGTPATIVGWSIGGVIALDLAARRPDLVGAVVIIEAPLFAKRHPRPEQIVAIVRAKIAAARGNHERGAELFLRWALARRGEAKDLDRLPASWRDGMLANARAILREIDAGTGERELDRDAMARIARPVLWLTGDRSARTFAAAARRAVRDHSGFTTVPIERSGHVMQHDRPDAVIDAVRAAEARSSLP